MPVLTLDGQLAESNELSLETCYAEPSSLPVPRPRCGRRDRLDYGLSEESCRGITLAVDEALANIIRHAYKSRYDQEIEVNCRTVEDELEFTFLDGGEPADPARICGQPMDEVSLERTRNSLDPGGHG